MMSFKFEYGDITKFPCDAIVNSIGTDTVVYGKLCDAIVKANKDPDYEKLLKDKNGKVKVLDCFVTNAKRLRVDYIINIVTPYAKKDFDYFFYCEAYKAIFNTARKHKLLDIAVPLIGTGPNGYSHTFAKQIVMKMGEAYCKYYPEMKITLLGYSPKYIKTGPKDNTEDELDELKNWIMVQKTGITFTQLASDLNFTKSYFDTDVENAVSIFQGVSRSQLLSQTRRDDFHDSIILPISNYEFPGYYLDMYLKTRYNNNKEMMANAKNDVMLMTSRKIVEHIYDRLPKDRIKFLLLALGAKMDVTECDNFLDTFGLSTKVMKRDEVFVYTFITQRYYALPKIKAKLQELNVIKDK